MAAVAHSNQLCPPTHTYRIEHIQCTLVVPFLAPHYTSNCLKTGDLIAAHFSPSPSFRRRTPPSTPTRRRCSTASTPSTTTTRARAASSASATRRSGRPRPPSTSICRRSRRTARTSTTSPARPATKAQAISPQIAPLMRPLRAVQAAPVTRTPVCPTTMR